jgi:DNA-binding response OmpR family regulator
MTSPEPSHVVLIVEDDPVVAETLELYLRHAGYAVAIERDGADGLARARDGGVALVILDWMIPGLNGHEVCRRLRAESTVPIMMLTARTSEDDRVRALETGADDYVPKPFSPREVVARVTALLRRAGQAADAVAPQPRRVGELEIDTWRREVRRRGRVVALTPAEFKLIDALTRHPGKTFTREELLASAFGPDCEALDRTIDTHVTNLRRKLEEGGSRRVLQTVHGVGYRVDAADAE